MYFMCICSLYFDIDDYCINFLSIGELMKILGFAWLREQCLFCFSLGFFFVCVQVRLFFFCSFYVGLSIRVIIISFSFCRCFYFQFFLSTVFLSRLALCLFVCFCCLFRVCISFRVYLFWGIIFSFLQCAYIMLMECVNCGICWRK